MKERQAEAKGKERQKAKRGNAKEKTRQGSAKGKARQGKTRQSKEAMQRHASLPTSKLVLRLFTSNNSPPGFLHAYSLWVVGCSDQSEKQRSPSHCANTVQQ